MMAFLQASKREVDYDEKIRKLEEEYREVWNTVTFNDK